MNNKILLVSELGTVGERTKVSEISSASDRIESTEKKVVKVNTRKVTNIQTGQGCKQKSRNI